MRTKGWEARLRAVDDAAMAFRVARQAATGIEHGWLRTVRIAVGVPVAELAGRMSVRPGELYRIECAEMRGVIRLRTLRKTAEALGCELVYGLAPKKETLTEMAAAIDAARAERRAETYARKLRKAKERRLDAAKQRWLIKEKEIREEYWKRRHEPMTASERRKLPKPPKGTPFWRVQIRKSLRQALREHGIRLR